MDHEATRLSERDRHLDEIVTAYLKAVEAGEHPEPNDWLQRYPDLAAELSAFFAGHAQVAALAGRDTIGFGGVPTLQGQTIRYFGDYELLEEVARGGMGVVYKAKQVSLNRVVAVKMILKAELATSIDVQRFRDEAKAAATLDHPNIVPIYEIGESEGQQYFSMKLIGPGQRRQNRGLPEVVRVVALAARAVHHAHQRGILHRDLKPSNILFDENGEPCVGDFGLAKRLEGDSGTTKSGVIVGTPSYMAPEQARAEKGLTTAVDVYSLGAVLYEWLTGQPPFRGADAMSTMMMVIAEEPPPRPRSLNRKIDRDLETICLKCLEKDPAKRYGSAEALADDLDRWQQGKPILARRIGSVQRLWRWCRRKPALAAATILALLSTFGVLALIVLGYFAQNELYCRKMLEGVEVFYKRGDVQGARAELRRSRDYFYFGLDAQWRGAALQTAASPELHPLRQVRIAEQRQGGPATVEWEDADLVRVRIGDDVQVCRVSTGELVAAKAAGARPKLTEASAKVQASLPKDAVLLGRSANDVWAVLRLSAKDAGKERIVLWNVPKQAEHGSLPDVGRISDIVLVSPDGRRMAYLDPFAVKPTETVRVWDWQWRRFCAVVETGYPQMSGQDLASLGGFSPNGEMLVTRGRDHYLPAWQVESGQLFTRVRDSNYRIAGCQWSPDSRKLAIVGPAAMEMPRDGNRDGVFLQLWEVRYPSPSYASREPISSHQSASSPSFSPAGQYLAWSGQFWKIGNRGKDQVLERVEDAHGQIHFGPDGSRWLIRLSLAKVQDNVAGQTLHAERLEPDPIVRTLLLPESKPPPGGKGQGRHIERVAMSQDGRHALLVTRRVDFMPQAFPIYRDEQLLEWWDLAEGKRLAIWNESAPVYVHGITLFAEGQFAVTDELEGPKLWDVASGKIKETFPSYLEGGYCLSADRRHLCRYTLGELRDGYIRERDTVLDIHEIATGKLVQHLELKDSYKTRRARPIAFHLQTGRLVTREERGGGSLAMWNLKTGKVWADWQPHEDAVFPGAALSPDGRHLVTSGGNTMRLWPLPYLLQEVEKLEHGNP